jgi:hypothetical protein
MLLEPGSQNGAAPTIGEDRVGRWVDRPRLHLRGKEEATA